jgi:hypothetical protein
MNRLCRSAASSVAIDGYELRFTVEFSPIPASAPFWARSDHDRQERRAQRENYAFGVRDLGKGGARRITCTTAIA